MATTIDNLRVDHRVTVLRAFTDAAGVAMRVGANGIRRALGSDQAHQEIHLGIQQKDRRVHLRIPLQALEGPRIGHLQEYFELGDQVSRPGAERIRSTSSCCARTSTAWLRGRPSFRR